MKRSPQVLGYAKMRWDKRHILFPTCWRPSTMAGGGLTKIPTTMTMIYEYLNLAVSEQACAICKRGGHNGVEAWNKLAEPTTIVWSFSNMVMCVPSGVIMFGSMQKHLGDTTSSAVTTVAMEHAGSRVYASTTGALWQPRRVSLIHALDYHQRDYKRKMDKAVERGCRRATNWLR